MMQQMKSLEIQTYFECVGIVICVMESSTNKAVNGHSVRMRPLRFIGLKGVDSILDNCTDLRNALVHSPLVKKELVYILCKIDKDEFISIICQLYDYIGYPISLELATFVVNTIYEFAYSKYNAIAGE